MRRIGELRSVVSLVVCLTSLSCREQSAPPVDAPQAAQSAPRELQPGDPAPEFTLPASDGRTYRLADFRGRAVVLAWFSKAFTDG